MQPAISSGGVSSVDVAERESSRQLAVSIVMPCLNEAETLATCVRKALQVIREVNCPGEVVVADNGSTDGSQQIAVREGARSVNVPIPGYGAALLAGITAANGEYVLMADADDNYNFFDLPKFLKSLEAGADLASSLFTSQEGFLRNLQGKSQIWPLTQFLNAIDVEHRIAVLSRGYRVVYVDGEDKVIDLSLPNVALTLQSPRQ